MLNFKMKIINTKKPNKVRQKKTAHTQREASPAGLSHLKTCKKEIKLSSDLNTRRLQGPISKNIIQKPFSNNL